MDPHTTPHPRAAWLRATWPLLGALLAAAGAVTLFNRPGAAAGAPPATAAPPASAADPSPRLVRLGNLVVNIDHVRTAIYNPETDQRYASVTIRMDDDRVITVPQKDAGRTWQDLARYLELHPVPPR